MTLVEWPSRGHASRQGTHSVAEAENRLPELIDRALAGEGVMITRHGRPVVELRPLEAEPGPVRPEGLDWLAARRAARGGAAPAQDAGQWVSGMRDDGEH
jgi:prevent-host-death family protein